MLDKRSNPVETTVNLPQYNSISRIEEKPYERVRYDKIQSSEEHPYAQLQPSTSRLAVHEDSQGTTEERSNLLRLVFLKMNEKLNKTLLHIHPQVQNSRSYFSSLGDLSFGQ